MCIRKAVTILVSGGLAAIAITRVPLSAARAEQPWTSFTSKAGRFSVQMPTQPVVSETKQKSFIGTITNHIFTAESGADIFTVDYSDIPRFALDFAGAETVYEHAQGALLKKTFGKARSFTDVTVAGTKGKRLVYDTPQASGQAKMRGDALLLLVGTRLYVIDGVVPGSEADAKAQRFLSSVEISE